MKTKIIKQEKNPFLQREELIVEIVSESTPNSTELISNLKKDDSLTVVKKINTNFGQQKFLAEIFVYESLEAKERIETIPQKIRKKIAADKKNEEETAKKKAKEEAKALKESEEIAKTETEKPVEEKTKETKNEVKKE